jgi:hypothetical protein
MHTGARGHLDGFPVQPSALLLRHEYYLEKRLNFPCDFRMNRNSRFYSASVQPV